MINHNRNTQRKHCSQSLQNVLEARAANKIPAGESNLNPRKSVGARAPVKRERPAQAALGINSAPSQFLASLQYPPHAGLKAPSLFVLQLTLKLLITLYVMKSTHTCLAGLQLSPRLYAIQSDFSQLVFSLACFFNSQEHVIHALLPMALVAPAIKHIERMATSPIAPNDPATPAQSVQHTCLAYGFSQHNHMFT